MIGIAVIGQPRVNRRAWPSHAFPGGHVATTVTTENLITENIPVIDRRCGILLEILPMLSIFLHNLLCRVKELLRNDRGMRVFYNDPFIGAASCFFVTVFVALDLPMNTVSQINLVAEYFPNGTTDPTGILESLVLGNPAKIAEFSGTGNTLTIQNCGNPVQGHPRGTHFKNSAYNRSRFLVNVIGDCLLITDIAVGNAACRRNIAPILYFGIDTRTNFLGYILDIVVIHDHLQGQHQ